MTETAETGLFLDIGHGSGSDNPELNLVAADNNFNSLRKSESPYKVLFDATSEHLPFPDASFPEVRILLPFGDLLVMLTQRDSSLYTEIHRVLKPGGKLNMVIDVPSTKKHCYYNRAHEEISIPDASLLVREALKKHPLFSKLHSYKLSQEEIKSLQSGTVKLITSIPGFRDSNPTLYRIYAKTRHGTK